MIPHKYLAGISILGDTAEMYLFGAQAYLSGIGFSLGVIFIAFVIVPIIYPLNITSALEYLKMRFHARHPKIVAIIITIGKLLLYMGITLFASAIALQVCSPSFQLSIYLILL